LQILLATTSDAAELKKRGLLKTRVDDDDVASDIWQALPRAASPAE
jgi:hypothetical protein